MRLMSAPRRLVPLLVLGGLAAGAPLPEPLGPGAGGYWLDSSPELRCDTAAKALRPTRRGVPAWCVYEFEATGPQPQLLVRYRAACGLDDRVLTEVAWPGGPFAPLPDPEPAGQLRRHDLTPYLREGGRLLVRLTLAAAGEPARVGLSELSWELDQVRRTPGTAPLPPATWLAGAERALRERRLAPGRAPDSTPPRGAGRRRQAVPALWQPLGQGWLAADWRPGRDAPALIWTVVARPGGQGGSLAVDELPRDAHALAYLPLGARVDPPPTAATPWPEVAVEGVAEPGDAVELRRCGRLELRWIAVRRPPGRLLCQAVVHNHTSESIAGNLRLRLVDDQDRETARAVAGADFPAGDWLAEVVVEHRPAARLELTVDDGTVVLDSQTCAVGGGSVELVDGEVYVDGRPRAVPRLTAPVAPARVAAAEAAGELLLIRAPSAQLAAQRLLWSASPAVAGVLPVE